jgi:hypothetical protein
MIVTMIAPSRMASVEIADGVIDEVLLLKQQRGLDALREAGLEFVQRGLICSVSARVSKPGALVIDMMTP